MLVYGWLISVTAVIALLIIVASCVCGCRKTVPKNELLGLAGMVKITNPEENLNHNYPQRNENEENTVPGSVKSSTISTNDANKRTTKTANRSLPDIPIDSERIRLDSGDTVWEGNEPNGDTCSELYATVEENKNAAQALASAQSGSRSSKFLSGVAVSDDGKSSEYSSLSQTDDSFSPYAQVVKTEHPYDYLMKSEHPYAQVGTSSDKPSTTSRSRLSGPAGTNYSTPVPPPRVRKANSFNSSLSSVVISDLPSPTVDIPAATAIAGRISANQELPYMTPPIPTPAMVSAPQTHFSGDSQDSSKGYTSISVREPLANIKAQTRQRSRTQELSDSLYATVSDDSEEMYAAIEDPQPVYTSGSETYAQIQPLAVVELAPVQNEPVAEMPHVPPQPPSVDSLKHVAQVHSRQASSSSAASSVANLGSPKPEKRQANSPLPPPPAISPELYATVEKKANRDSPMTDKTLEEMYAKVIKKHQRSVVRLEPDEVVPEPSISRGITPEDDTSGASGDISSSRESLEIRLHKTEVDADSLSSLQSDFSASKIDGNNLHPYQLLPATPAVQLDYESVNSVETPAYVDPGYEVVKRTSGAPLSDSDPNYEVLRPQVAEQDYQSYFSVNSERSNSEPGYASIAPTIGDPGYEQVGSRSFEPGYASINKNRKSSDTERDEPNYESMRHVTGEAISLAECDPNYESVYSNLPPYERLLDDGESVAGYEKVDLGQSSSERLTEVKDTEYEEVDVRRKTSSNSEVWDTGRHKLI